MKIATWLMVAKKPSGRATLTRNSLFWDRRGSWKLLFLAKGHVLRYHGGKWKVCQ